MEKKFSLSLLLLCGSLISQETPVKEAPKPKVTVETKEEAVNRVTEELKTLPKLVKITYDEFEDTSSVSIVRKSEYLPTSFSLFVYGALGTGKMRYVGLSASTVGDSWLFMDSAKFLDRNTRKTHTVQFPGVRRSVFDSGGCYEGESLPLSLVSLDKFDDWSKLAVRVYGSRGHREAKPEFTSKAFKDFKLALRILNEAYRLKIDPVDVVPTLGKNFRL